LGQADYGREIHVQFYTDPDGTGGRDGAPATAGAGRPVAGRWTVPAYACLTVALYAAGPAVIHLTVSDHVQLHRVTGTSAERYGDLIPPGTTPVRLTAGTYLLRTTADAQVQLDRNAAVTVTAVTQPADKDTWPDPGTAQGLPASKGDSPPDHVPALTIRW
jgi:hypothetical protein